MEKIKLVLAGEGGQGVQTIASILSAAAFESGVQVSYIPSFGVEQRGAPSVAYLTFSDSNLRYSKPDVMDVAVILSPRASRAIEKNISPNTKIIFDSTTTSVSDLPKVSMCYFGLPATGYAVEKFKKNMSNIIVLSAISSYLNIVDKDVLWRNLKRVLKNKIITKKDEGLFNDAFLFGLDVLLEEEKFSKPKYKSKHKEIIEIGHDKIFKIQPKRCKGCGICISKCPTGALEMGDDYCFLGNPLPKINLERCVACGNCKNFCPDGCISVIKKQ